MSRKPAHAEHGHGAPVVWDPSASSARRGRWLIGAGAVLVIAGSAVWWYGARSSAPAAPAVPLAPEQMSPELEELVDTYIAAIRAAPDDARRHAELAMVYEANRIWAQAGESYARALALDDAQPTWAHHAALISYYSESDLGGAIEALREVTQRFPSYAPAFHRLGDFLVESGDLAGAKVAFEACVRLAPRLPDGYTSLGDLALRQGDLDLAQQQLQRALQLDPSYGAPHFLLGRVYQKRGSTELAARELELGRDQSKRVMIDPLAERLIDYVARVDEQVARASELLRQRNYVRAEELARRVLAREPEHVVAMIDLGIALLEQKRLDQALEVLERANALDPERADARVNLAAGYLATQRPNDALREAERAIALDPGFAQAHFLRSQALLFSGQQARSLDPMQRAVELAPRDPKLLASLAMLQKNLKLFEDARKTTLELTRLMAGDWKPWADLVHLDVQLGDVDAAENALRRMRELGGDPKLAAALAAQVEGLRQR